MTKQYFVDLFQASNADFQSVIEAIPNLISSEDNDILLQTFTKDEFSQALQQMHSDKAPGPDGLNSAFYKRLWHLSGDEVFHASQYWLEQGYFTPHLNDTNVVIIPKNTNPSSRKDLRPISLCNIVYKILSKVLANQLKPLLSKCISPEQSAFAENRSILDNAMVAIETIHHMNCKVGGKDGEVALR